MEGNICFGFKCGHKNLKYFFIFPTIFPFPFYICYWARKHTINYKDNISEFVCQHFSVQRILIICLILTTDSLFKAQWLLEMTLHHEIWRTLWHYDIYGCEYHSKWDYSFHKFCLHLFIWWELSGRSYLRTNEVQIQELDLQVSDKYLVLHQIHKYIKGKVTSASCLL